MYFERMHVSKTNKALLSLAQDLLSWFMRFPAHSWSYLQGRVTTSILSICFFVLCGNHVWPKGTRSFDPSVNCYLWNLKKVTKGMLCKHVDLCVANVSPKTNHLCILKCWQTGESFGRLWRLVSYEDTSQARTVFCSVGFLGGLSEGKLFGDILITTSWYLRFTKGSTHGLLRFTRFRYEFYIRFSKVY